MEYILGLTEEYYEEIYTKNIPHIPDELISTLEVCDAYRAYERPYSFFIGRDGEVKISGSNLFLKLIKNWFIWIKGGLEKAN